MTDYNMTAFRDDFGVRRDSVSTNNELFSGSRQPFKRGHAKHDTASIANHFYTGNTIRR